jgi:outer membrane receptor for ferrienterochelin and colicins
MRLLPVAACFCLLSPFWSQVAQADPAAEARFHDDAARKHYEAGDYEKALREFFLEQRAAPNPRIAFNIALCFQELKKDEDAYHFFREYLASRDDDPKRRATAESTLRQLESRVARVRVETGAIAADVFVDQRAYGSYGQTPLVIALPVGEHQLWVELAGYRSATAKFTARKGQEARVELNPARILGELDVACLVPATAQITTADGEAVARGSTPLKAKLPPGTYQLTVSAPGYLPWAGVTTVVADGVAQATASPQRAPVATGDITVTSNLPGALVVLDGEPAGFAPTVLSGIAQGRHQLGAKSPGVLPWVGPVDVDAEARSWVTVSLEPPARFHHSSATWLAGGLGGAALAGAGVFGILAANTHSDFAAADPSSDRSVLRERGIALNTAADVLLVTGVVALGAAVALYFTTSEKRGRESSASITSSKR